MGAGRAAAGHAIFVAGRLRVAVAGPHHMHRSHQGPCELTRVEEGPPAQSQLSVRSTERITAGREEEHPDLI